LLLKQNEINPKVAEQLWNVLSTCKVVVLCDDSDSMAQAIAEEGTDPFAVKRSTRWLELKKLVAVIINFATSISSDGIDIYFLNRPKVTGVTSLTGLQTVFSVPPTGGTPLCASLQRIYQDHTDFPADKKLLIVVITDGEPTDGTRTDLFNVLARKASNIHVSFSECTDQAEDMEYLDQWDGLIPNFDNTDDYREELARVKAVQGMQFKFDYTDYVIKILLATFVRTYFNVDQVKIADSSAMGMGTSNTTAASSAIVPTAVYSAPMQVVQPVVIYQPPPPMTVQTAPPPQYYQAAPAIQSGPAPSGCCVVL